MGIPSPIRSISLTGCYRLARDLARCSLTRSADRCRRCRLRACVAASAAASEDILTASVRRKDHSGTAEFRGYSRLSRPFIQRKIGVYHMTILDWMFTSLLIMVYLVCLFTVCLLTFRKGYVALGIIGIFIPFLWLIGAILPAKRGSQYEMAERTRLQAQSAIQ